MEVNACTLPTEIINYSLRRSGLIHQIEGCLLGDISTRAGDIDAEAAPIISLRPIGGLNQGDNE
jgi:hypothetical protein